MLNDKLKKLFKINEVNKKINIENTVVFLIILIVTIIIINTIWKDEKTENIENIGDEALVNVSKTQESKTNIGDETAEKIKEILSKIEGVGKVEVLITYSETNQVIAMYNEKYRESQTEEEDTNGGTRTIQELNKDKEIIYEEENGIKTPITEKIIMPKMEGALIVAEGANNSNIKANIIQAVEALTGLATHKIQVLEMGKGIK